ncbi:MAG: PhzF family phenazine biosynthesis protein [Burkholderiaceae bacterium]|nr:PhzF family phenazine biosynthesis protein [Burkholderiaceae bacterium]
MTLLGSHPFAQVDVFADRPLAGNPVAVVFDADDLGTERMQALARWTNLSETTFVCRPTSPGADYRLRIFTPAAELPFAGHPTLGSAHAVRAMRGPGSRNARLVQECAAGLVSLRVDQSGGLALELPPVAERALATSDEMALVRAVALRPDDVGAHATLDVGPRWTVLELEDADAVLAVTPDPSALAALSKRLDLTGVVVFGRHRPDAAPPGEDGTDSPRYEVRAFAPAHGVPEDPVCGSGNGCVAALLARRGETDYVASQGRVCGRDGRVQIRYEGGTIWLGGQCVTTIEGRLSL